jgi:excisionase family DNA binding protein
VTVDARQCREFLTPVQVARRYHLSPHSVWKLIREGKIPAYRRGDGPRFLIDAAEADAALLHPVKVAG